MIWVLKFFSKSLYNAKSNLWIIGFFSVKSIEVLQYCNTFSGGAILQNCNIAIHFHLSIAKSIAILLKSIDWKSALNLTSLNLTCLKVELTVAYISVLYWFKYSSIWLTPFGHTMGKLGLYMANVMELFYVEKIEKFCC